MESSISASATDKDPKPKITRRRRVQVCDRCRTRRIRCDRLQPACSACLKSGHPCLYQEASDKDSVAVSKTRRQDTQSANVKGLEELVNRLQQQLEGGQGDNSTSEGNGTAAEAQLHGLVVPGQELKYFSPMSWAAVSENIADIRHLLNQHHLQEDDADSEDESSEPTPSLSVFPPASPDSDHIDVPYLSEDQSTALLHVYFDRVDCMIKIVHRATFLERYRSYRQTRTSPHSAQNESPIDLFGAGPISYAGETVVENAHEQSIPNARAFEALLLTVYYAASVAGCADEALKPHFIDDMVTSSECLATSYRRAAESALEKANFIQSESLETLQALILLISVRPRGPDPRTPWVQLGLAVRIAQAMGLHRDGSHYGLDPVETEVRRRLWAQIRLLDLRAAEELGCEPTILEGTYDTTLPSNVSDDDLSITDSSQLRDLDGNEARRASEHLAAPTPWTTQHNDINLLPLRIANAAPQFSEMTFPLIRFEAVRLLGKLLSPRYQPKDLLYGTVQGGQPEHTQSARAKGKRAVEDKENKIIWAEQLEKRYHDVYGIQNLDLTEPKRRITAKVATILLAKAKFIANLQDWKETSPQGSKVEEDEIRNSLFLTAVAIVEETSLLIQDRVLINWSWYVSTFTEVYACTFVLSNLVKGGVSPEISERCWKAIDCLFPASSANDSQSKSREPLQKLVAYARARRQSEQIMMQGGLSSSVGIGVDSSMQGIYSAAFQMQQDVEYGGLSWVDQFVDEMVGSRLPPWNDLTEYLFQ